LLVFFRFGSIDCEIPAFSWPDVYQSGSFAGGAIGSLSSETSGAAALNRFTTSGTS
jgi:hypothetical protein